MLRIYCVYVLFLAENGISEAFFMVGRSNQSSLGYSGSQGAGVLQLDDGLLFGCVCLCFVVDDSADGIHGIHCRQHREHDVSLRTPRHLLEACGSR